MSGNGNNDVTELIVEWTNQHGCGDNDRRFDPSKLNCNIVIQYMEQDASMNTNSKDRMRDGTTTNQQAYSNIPGESRFRFYF